MHIYINFRLPQNKKQTTTMTHTNHDSRIESARVYYSLWCTTSTQRWHSTDDTALVCILNIYIYIQFICSECRTTKARVVERAQEMPAAKWHHRVYCPTTTAIREVCREACNVVMHACSIYYISVCVCLTTHTWCNAIHIVHISSYLRTCFVFVEHHTYSMSSTLYLHCCSDTL